MISLPFDKVLRAFPFSLLTSHRGKGIGGGVQGCWRRSRLRKTDRRIGVETLSAAALAEKGPQNQKSHIKRFETPRFSGTNRVRDHFKLFSTQYHSKL
eukprot:scaffold1830_cov246-Pinguiococcus_pyrenoidosus.AAC.17